MPLILELLVDYDEPDRGRYDANCFSAKNTGSINMKY
jgi:hypothetical protein